MIASGGFSGNASERRGRENMFSILRVAELRAESECGVGDNLARLLWIECGVGPYA
jgi:hypothetical protein